MRDVQRGRRRGKDGEKKQTDTQTHTIKMKWSENADHICVNESNYFHSICVYFQFIRRKFHIIAIK